MYCITEPYVAPTGTAVSAIHRNSQSQESGQVRWWACALLLAAHWLATPPMEPVFNGDENRHVMTSVFFRDVMTDRPVDNLQTYAKDYYEQYPALGLLIWPPLFHGMAGLAMTIFGTSVQVPRVLVFLSFVGATWCLQRICRRRMETEQAWFVATVFAVTPLVFEFSRYVMLEMPTLALCLVCLDQFDVWLARDQKRHLFSAALAAAFAALTRFDAIVLLPMLLLFATFEGRWRRLADRQIAFAAVTALLLVAPTYFVIWSEMGELHLRQAAESVSGRDRPSGVLERILFYPSQIPEQIGWVATVFVVTGLLSCLRKEHRAAVPAFGAILIATFVTFTPLAELTSRHTIYWLPSLAWLASIGAIEASRYAASRSTVSLRNLRAAIPMAFLLAATAAHSFTLPPHQVSGYARAVQAAITHSEPGDSILIEGWWDGNLTYHLRHLDPRRSRHVIRADKELYDFTNVPNVDFRQFVRTDAEILAAIARLNPQCIVFEDPQPYGTIEISRQMRRLIRSRTDLFPHVKTVPVSSTVPNARQFSLHVFVVNSEELNAVLHE